MSVVGGTLNQLKQWIVRRPKDHWLLHIERQPHTQNGISVFLYDMHAKSNFTFKDVKYLPEFGDNGIDGHFILDFEQMKLYSNLKTRVQLYANDLICAQVLPHRKVNGQNRVFLKLIWGLIWVQPIIVTLPRSKPIAKKTIVTRACISQQIGRSRVMTRTHHHHQTG
jgi:hypothetical protein